MSPAEGLPWHHASLQLLDLRAQDRVLAISCNARQVQDLVALVGRRGEITVVQESREIAESIANLGLACVEVLAHRIEGGERFGSFDAMLAAPAWGPLLGGSTYGELARTNLRPGGRCVVDVPALDMVPDLAAAGAEMGWPARRFEALCGIGTEALAEALTATGLRGVKSLLGSHLLHVFSPHEIVDLFAEALHLSPEERLELDHAMVRRSGGTGPIDALVHRSRVQALR